MLNIRTNPFMVFCTLVTLILGVFLSFMAHASPEDPYLAEPLNRKTLKTTIKAEGMYMPENVVLDNKSSHQQPVYVSPAKVKLEHLEQTKLTSESNDQQVQPGIPLKIGFPRDILTLQKSSKTNALYNWSKIDGGMFTAISVISPDAVGVRLGVLIEQIPNLAVLRFYAQGTKDFFQVSGKEINELIAVNLEAGDTSEEARTYWSPVIEGQEITLEIELPPGVSTQDVNISIPRISHMFSSALNTQELEEKIAESASCNLDSRCYSSTWGEESTTTARMVFVEAGYMYLCTGTLLNDKDTSTLVPYFLSAAHCISTQTVASSLQTNWFYRSSSCNGNTLDSANKTVTGGATLLYQSKNTDTSFMRLNSSPPPGVWLSGWAAGTLNIDAYATGIHNPNGDLQKINFGNFKHYLNCTLPDSDGRISCSTGSSTTGNYLDVSWSQGITEPGSSGSGFWVTDNGQHYLVGQLYGGSGSCSSSERRDVYGSFDVAFYAALYKWLNQEQSAPKVIEFYNNKLDHYFITANASEAAAIDNGSAGPGWSRTGNIFQSGGSHPVCRFYGSMSPGPNSHFYTMAGAECDNLKELQLITPSTQKRWNFESLDFISTPSNNETCPVNTVPVYRAYNNGFIRGIDSNHRITTNLTSIQQMVACGWENEGIVMCASSGTTSGGTTICGSTDPLLSSLQGAYEQPISIYTSGSQCSRLGVLSGTTKTTVRFNVTTSGNSITAMGYTPYDACEFNFNYASGNSVTGFNLNGSATCNSGLSSNTVTTSKLKRVGDQLNGTITMPFSGCTSTLSFN